ncbi:MAG TPA: branched-chain amino acid ABC transporter permease [Methylomirabilota bacterium]|nr:branched-chain amino acid ABC transporter permease [Methylomirabilota bacterium]
MSGLPETGATAERRGRPALRAGLTSTRLPAAALGAAALGGLASLSFWAPTFWVSIAIQALIFAIFAMSIDLLLGYGGLASFGHAAFYGAGALACAKLALVSPNLGLLPLLAGSIAVAALLAAPIGALSLRVRGVYFLMLTLAFAQVLWGFAFQAPREWLGGSDGLIGVDRPPLDLLERADEQLWALFGVSPRAVGTRHLYNLTLILSVLVLCFLFLLVRSPFGRTLEGIRENEHRMRALGCPTFRYQLAGFVVAGSLAGLAGALLTLFNGSAQSGSLYWTNSGLVLIAAIVGGTRTLVGPAVGAFVVLIVQDALSTYSQRWQLLLGALFIAFVLFLPNGLVSVGRALRALRPR